MNVVLFQTLNHRIDRLEDRFHQMDDRLQTELDLLVGKVGEMDIRLARLEERLAR